MKVTQYDNIFSEELYLEIYDYIQQLILDKNTEFLTNITFWNKQIVKSSSCVLVYKFCDKDSKILLKIKKELENKIPYKIKHIMVHVWTNLSYIPWHDDSDKDAALTVYMNKHWDRDWGGYFLYEKENEIKALLPKKNFGVLQEGGVMHSVSTINIGAEHRITLQTFFNKKSSFI